MKNFFFLLPLFLTLQLTAQKAEDLITVSEVTRIETFLSSDDMRGRKAGTPDIEKAAHFIAAEFQKAGLQGITANNYRQEFLMLRPKLIELKLKIDDKDVEAKNIIVVTTVKDLKVDENAGYEMAFIKAGENLFTKANDLAHNKKNTIVMVDTSFAANFSRLTFLKRQLFSTAPTTIFILGTGTPKDFKIKAEHSFTEIPFANIVGVLPGKSKKNEYVIFSGHYDHIGVGKPVNGDSIYNGANDDAAGITAVIMLANYFKKLGPQERTLIFAAFTAEEIGGFGSQYFSQQYNPAQIMAMMNIEMVGTESKWGKNSAFITGFDKSDMGAILQKNLKGTAFTFHPDPYPDQQLFYRSDNATLAALGVPAHTISTAKMENEPHYHKPSDEISTLDMQNMVEIIKAIALSSRSIVSGKDTPGRVRE
jgi:Zn-dependent M28 family amino/carboxypeptidase